MELTTYFTGRGEARGAGGGSALAAAGGVEKCTAGSFVSPKRIFLVFSRKGGCHTVVTMALYLAQVLLSCSIRVMKVDALGADVQ